MDDKRQLTIVPAATAAGDFLPLQVIFTGKKERSLPPPVCLEPLSDKGRLCTGLRCADVQNSCVRGSWLLAFSALTL